jgi:hypothetical protein
MANTSRGCIARRKAVLSTKPPLRVKIVRIDLTGEGVARKTKVSGPV